MRKDNFFDVDNNQYTCPAGQLIPYNTTNRLGYRECHSDSEQCRERPFLDQCTRSRNRIKVVTRHVSLRALSSAAPCEWPVFTGGGVPEYEEDCAVTTTFFTFVGR